MFFAEAGWIARESSKDWRIGIRLRDLDQEIPQYPTSSKSASCLLPLLGHGLKQEPVCFSVQVL